VRQKVHEKSAVEMVDGEDCTGRRGYDDFNTLSRTH